MKRFTIFAIMALFLLGTVATASAVEMKASGSWRVSGNWMSNMNDFDDDDSSDNFNVKQRARTYFEFIANEDLKGVLKTEIGDFYWGNGAGEVSGDEEAIEVKNAYLDFNIPNTEVNIKAGLQGLTLPGFVGGSPLFSDDVAGLTFNAPITDMVGVTGGWGRLQDNDVNESETDDSGDDLDLGFLAVPLNFDGLEFAPYFGYVWIGKDVLANTNSSSSGSITLDNGTVMNTVSNDSNNGPWAGISNPMPWMNYIAEDHLAGVNEFDDSGAWYAGIPMKLSMFDPLVVMADVHYGRMDIEVEDADKDDIEIKGWLADLAVEYKMDMMTPMIFGSYSTGLDKDDVDDDEYGIYPAIDGCWAVDTMLTDNSAFGVDLALYQPVSMWTVGARLKDISFVEDLTHEVGVIYAKGTSDKEVANFGNDGLLNDDESLLAADFTTKYMIYENLAAIAELGYAKYDADYADDVEGDDDTDNAYKAVVGFKYDF